MWCFRPRFCQSNNVFILCSLLLAAGFLLQIKVLYNSHLKHIRFQEYNYRVNEVRETMSTVERVANYTTGMIRTLQIRIKTKNIKKSKHKIS